MQDSQSLLEFAEQYINGHSDQELTSLQRVILSEALKESTKRKTYDQIALKTGYSSKYVKQAVGPQLWQLLTVLLGQKVTKINVRLLFLEKYQANDFEASLSTPSTATQSQAGVESLTDAASPIDEPVSAVSQAETDALPKQPAPIPQVDAIAPFSTIPDIADTPVILIVDDQPQNIALLSEILENDGYEVRQAISGELALQSAFMAPPDLILLDINMPGMNGYEVCQQLKVDQRTEIIPIIFISALNQMWDKVQAFSVGGSDYITKPFKAMEVIARIENQLKIRRLYAQLYKLMAKAQYGDLIMQSMQVLEPTMGLANRAYFDKTLQRCWQKSLDNQTAISLILCQFDSIPEPEISDPATPYKLDSPLPQRIVVNYPSLANIILTIINPVNGLATAYNKNTIAILFLKMDAAQQKTIIQQIKDALAPHLQAMSLTLSLRHTNMVAQADKNWQSVIVDVEGKPLC